jgi:hypothetical protein
MHERRPHKRFPAVTVWGGRAMAPGAKLVTTGMAWLVVYLLLLTLFGIFLTLFGIFEDQLAALTLPIRLLVVSGMHGEPGGANRHENRRRVDRPKVNPEASRCQRRPRAAHCDGDDGEVHMSGNDAHGKRSDENRC